MGVLDDSRQGHPSVATLLHVSASIQPHACVRWRKAKAHNAS